MWDVAYDGYCGGKNMSVMKWDDAGVDNFIASSSEVTTNYSGDSILCVPIRTDYPFKSPLPMCDSHMITPQLGTGDLLIQDVNSLLKKQVPCAATKSALAIVFNRLEMHQDFQMVKDACQAVGVGETTQCRLLYKGTSTFAYTTANKGPIPTFGCGHHGHDYVGVASVRNGKSLMAVTAPTINVVKSSPHITA